MAVKEKNTLSFYAWYNNYLVYSVTFVVCVFLLVSLLLLIWAGFFCGFFGFFNKGFLSPFISLLCYIFVSLLYLINIFGGVKATLNTYLFVKCLAVTRQWNLSVILRIIRNTPTITFTSPKTYISSITLPFILETWVNFYKHLIFLLICIFIILQMVSTETLDSASFFSF